METLETSLVPAQNHPPAAPWCWIEHPGSPQGQREPVNWGDLSKKNGKNMFKQHGQDNGKLDHLCLGKKYVICPR